MERDEDEARRDLEPQLTLTATGAGLGASLTASFFEAFLETSLGAASFLDTLVTFLLSDLAILIVMKGIKKKG